MNRFVKKNLGMVVILSGAGVLAAGLLVYALLLVFDLDTYINRTSEARDSVQKLRRQDPRPGKENEERIQRDIEVYRKAAQGLRAHFQLPLQEAFDLFINTLEPPHKAMLTEEEVEQYKVPPKDGEEDDKAKLRIRKFTKADFHEFFKNRFEKAMENRNENLRYTENSLREFIMGFRNIFPNWNAAVAKFRTRAQDLTNEPINTESVTLSLLFATAGFQRFVPDDPPFSHLVNFREVLMKKAYEKKIAVMPSAMDFLVKWNQNGMTDFSNYSVPNRRVVLFHWDVLGNILDVLIKSGISSLHNIAVRNYADASAQELNLQQTFVEDGDYLVYHYTLEVSGTMENIRKLAANFDLEHENKRTYVVRAVTLYAEENGAGFLMKQGVNATVASRGSDPAAEVGRGRGRGRGREITEEPAPTPDGEKQNEEEDESKKPVEQRKGYGEILVGSGNEFHAFIDVDYIVLKSNQ